MEIKTTSSLSEGNIKKDEKPEVIKVVSGKVKVKKKSIFKKVADAFISEDADSVGDYLVSDVLIPAIKDTIADLLHNSTDMIFYGRVRSNKSKSGYVSYNSYSSGTQKRTAQRARSLYSFDDIVVESRAEAERVIDLLNEMIDRYGEATVADFYELVGVSGNGYTDRSYGWKDLRNAYVTRVREGYLFNLPRCTELD